MRYCGVSAINVIVGQGVLAFCLIVMEFGGVVSQIISVVISAIPAYILSRHWVWKQDGEVSFRNEILPFWGMALLGLALAVTCIAAMERVTDQPLVLMATSLGAFGVVWSRVRHSRQGDVADRAAGHHMSLDPDLLRHAEAARGFMPPNEGVALAAAARRCPCPARISRSAATAGSRRFTSAASPSVRVGFCSLDHHRGSEENQAGWEHHEPDLVDDDIGKMDTLPIFRRTVHDAGLEGTVVALVGDSPTVGAVWDIPLALLFIDGGHGHEPAHRDYETWVPHVKVGGTLLIHDVFPDPADGGRPPTRSTFGRWNQGRSEKSMSPVPCAASSASPTASDRPPARPVRSCPAALISRRREPRCRPDRCR